jgi:hypoxanthine phosphoribosyltransferase
VVPLQAEDDEMLDEGGRGVTIRMSWEEANTLTADLARKVHEYTPDYYNRVERVGYVLLGRGGLAVGGMLARHLDMRYVFYLPMNRGDQFQWFKAWFRGTWANIIICDTGETMIEMLKLLHSHASGKELLLLTLLKRHSCKLVSGVHYAKRIDSPNYVVFPWEVCDKQMKEGEPF